MTADCSSGGIVVVTLVVVVLRKCWLNRSLRFSARLSNDCF